MYRLLRFLLLGTWKLPTKCEHNFIEIERYEIGNERTKRITNIKVYERCSKCGEHRIFTINA